MYVANRTPYPVEVVLTLRPRSGSVVIDKPVEVTLEPQTRRQQVLVPTKALASGADVAIVDLEDAVLPGRKVDARRHVREFLDTIGPRTTRHPAVHLRVRGVFTNTAPGPGRTNPS